MFNLNKKPFPIGDPRPGFEAKNLANVIDNALNRIPESRFNDGRNFLKNCVFETKYLPS